MIQVTQSSRQHRSRRGFSMTELLVAASLMVVVMGTVTPLAIRSGRLWQGTRNEQRALQEMANQLELVTTLKPQEREQAVAEMKLSRELTEVLPEAKLTAELISDQAGSRLVVSFYRDSISKPQALVGWFAFGEESVQKEESK
ncbi:MAG: prepilin-type N-terminal cleavage/methylation domain-containing protein [Rubripirellula sp.]